MLVLAWSPYVETFPVLFAIITWEKGTREPEDLDAIPLSEPVPLTCIAANKAKQPCIMEAYRQTHSSMARTKGKE